MTIDFTAPEWVDNQGVKLAVYRAGPTLESAEKPPVLFLHGWPEIAYSWRKQMAALADAGYPVFAPDNRGFGKSDKPEGVEHYGMPSLVSDVEAILDHWGLEKAVIVGHDWGALILWSLPFYIPDRLMGCVGLNVALMGHPPMDPIAMFRRAYGDKMYMVRFQEEGACEPILEADMARTFRFFFRKPKGGSRKIVDGAFENEQLDLIGLLQSDDSKWGGVPLMSEEDIAVYVDGYRDGMTAPLHWYRNMTHNWQELGKRLTAAGKLPMVDVPCLQFLASMDRACPPSLADGMNKRCSDLEIIMLDGCGHWSQLERTDDVNTGILSWLDRKF